MMRELKAAVKPAVQLGQIGSQRLNEKLLVTLLVT